MLRIPTTTLFRELEGELFLVNVNTGYYFGLNRIGSRMWRALERHGRVDDALLELEGEYEVEPDRLRADLSDLVEKLRENGLIEDVDERS